MNSGANIQQLAHLQAHNTSRTSTSGPRTERGLNEGSGKSMNIIINSILYYYTFSKLYYQFPFNFYILLLLPQIAAGFTAPTTTSCFQDCIADGIVSFKEQTHQCQWTQARVLHHFQQHPGCAVISMSVSSRELLRYNFSGYPALPLP